MYVRNIFKYLYIFNTNFLLHNNSNFKRNDPKTLKCYLNNIGIL